MAEEDIAGTAGTAGQVGEGTEATTGATPEGTEGQLAAGTTDNGTQEDVIFDPVEFDKMTESLPPELQSQAKALRKSLTIIVVA